LRVLPFLSSIFDERDGKCFDDVLFPVPHSDYYEVTGVIAEITRMVRNHYVKKLA